MRSIRQSKFRRTRTWVRLWKFLNKPLLVTVCGGLLVFYISNHIQERFTEAQARFQFEQGKRASQINSASAAQDEILRALGKRFIGIAALLAAYREHYTYKQYHETIQYSLASAHEWDFSSEIIKVKVNFYFPDAEIQKHWNYLIEELNKFDDEVNSLNNNFRAATNASKELDAAVASCDKTLDRVSLDVGAFAQQLLSFIRQEERKPLT